mgnify:FL=1
MQENQEEKSLGELFSGLDEVIANLEKEDVSLEESFSFYHRGMDLLKMCNDKIDRVEKQMQILDEEGNIHEF